MRMRIVCSFPEFQCGRSKACGGIRSLAAAEARSDRRQHRRPYQLHELGDTRVNAATRDRIQRGFPIGALNADEFLF